ncbi:hypothetical protein IVB31_07865 [Bradyrhizobium sp. 21]|nr:hypothetical protein [Bradyrhizobium sp. 21]
MAKSSDVTRAVSRHTLSYMLCSVSEMFRHYGDFAAMDLLIIHGILNANVTNVMSDVNLNERFSGIDAVEPDAIKRGVSRAALSRFLNVPLETIRRRVTGLKRLEILTETSSGLIVAEGNAYGFGNNHELQMTNMLLVRKLLRDLRAAGVTGPDDLLQPRGKSVAQKARLPRPAGRNGPKRSHPR